MPTYSISGPDGKTYSIDGPEGATRDQVIAKIKEKMPQTPEVQPTEQKTGNVGHAGPPTAIGATLSGLQDSGFVKGLKVGAEELPYGLAQAGMALSRGMGIKPPQQYANKMASDVANIETQDKGTGIPGAIGEMVPAMAIPGDEEAQGAKTLGDLVKQGAKQGVKAGGTFAAVAPTTNPKETLGQRGLNTMMGGAGGAVLGTGSSLLGAGVSKLAGKAAEAAPKIGNEFQKAANFFGMNFSGAKTDEQIAQEIQRSVAKQNDNIGSMIADRAEAPQSKVSQVGDVGRGIVSKFAERKTNEDAAWGAAEPAGNAIPHDMNTAVEKLTAKVKELEEATANGTGTEKAKADLALTRDALAKIGAPVQIPQQVTEQTRDVGGYKKTINAGKQFPADAAQTATKKVEPTTTVGNKKFKEVTQTPVGTQTNVDGKTKTIEQSPYTVTTKTVKGEAAKPPRPGTAGDLVRTMRDVVNSDKYSDASSATRKEVRGIINDELVEASKENPNFSKLHKKAIDWTQRNADLYRDEGKMAQYGLSEEKLWQIQNKINKDSRMVSLSDIQELNRQSENIKTKEDLLEYRRLLHNKQLYSTLMRTRYATLMSDINMNLEKFKEARPLLEEMLKQSQIPKEKIATFLDNYETVAEKMTDAGVDATGKLSRTEKEQARLKEIQKAILFGGALHNPKQGIFHGIQAAFPSPTKEQLALRNFKKAAMPTNTVYPGSINNVPGAIAGQTVRQNQ